MDSHLKLKTKNALLSVGYNDFNAVLSHIHIIYFSVCQQKQNVYCTRENQYPN